MEIAKLETPALDALLHGERPSRAGAQTVALENRRLQQFWRYRSIVIQRQRQVVQLAKPEPSKVGMLISEERTATS